MKLLILGGTLFLGRHLVEAALRAGHEVTLFNRGEHNADLYPEVEKLRGNRDGNLDALRGRSWDAVVDTCGYTPRLVGDSARLLGDSVQHYTFISSVSVYGNVRESNVDEGGAIAELVGDDREEVKGPNYGPLKALSEEAAEAAMPNRVLNVRPGLIVGPWDPTDRFSYWLRRIVDGGEILAPGRKNRSVQFIDARDLCDWILHCLGQGKTGVYNATGPAAPLAMEEFLQTCIEVTGSQAKFCWADDQFLESMKVEPWSELPLWIPDNHEMRGFCSFNCSRAIADGLTFRPLSDTIATTLQWLAKQDPDSMPRTALSRERERELLLAWERRL